MLKKWVYGLIIAVVWVTSGFVTVSFLFVEIPYSGYPLCTFNYVNLSFDYLCLLNVHCYQSPLWSAASTP